MVGAEKPVRCQERLCPASTLPSMKPKHLHDCTEKLTHFLAAIYSAYTIVSGMGLSAKKVREAGSATTAVSSPGTQCTVVQPYENRRLRFTTSSPYPTILATPLASPCFIIAGHGFVAGMYQTSA